MSLAEKDRMVWELLRNPEKAKAFEDEIEARGRALDIRWNALPKEERERLSYDPDAYWDWANSER